MHSHRTVSAEPASRRANLPPPAGKVHGLGLVDALRIDVTPAQLPWLADEIQIVRYCLEDELEHQRARHNGSPASATQDVSSGARDAQPTVDLLRRQLEILAMIRKQVPISNRAAKAAVAVPWTQSAGDLARECECAAGPVVVVGPAALMTVLVRGALRLVAHQLGEALGAPALDVDEHTDSTGGWRAEQVPLVSPAIARKLRGMAAAAQAFTDTYLDVLAHQTYSFDPGARPLRAGGHEQRNGSRPE